MRQTLTGIVTAIGLMTAGAAPAMACGYGGCCGGYFSPCAPTYGYAPAYTYGYGYGYGCGSCGGWAYERLAEPTTQYYYVNQGPTYTGPGAFAPYPTYQEDALPYYPPQRYYPWRHTYRYGYVPHHYGYHYGPYYHGRRVLRRYY
jgi:hypothetical protein